MSLRAGIVGPRGIGTVHARSLAAIGVPVTAVVASSLASAQEHAARLGVERAFASVDELVASGVVDVVHVCTPNLHHATAVITALEAGCHVVCEKPLTLDPGDALALLEASSRTDRGTAVCYHCRYLPGVQALAGLVRSGALGTIEIVRGATVSAELRGLPDDHWLTDPAVTGPTLSVADVGTHWLDLIEHVTGLRIAAVVARPSAAQSDATPFRHGAALMLELDNGAVGGGVISQDAAGIDDEITLELHSAEATARWSLDHGGERLVVSRDGEPPAPVDLPPRRWQENADDAFVRLMGSIYERLRTGTSDAPTFADGQRGVALLDAVARSAAEGTWVAVEAAPAAA